MTFAKQNRSRLDDEMSEKKFFEIKNYFETGKEENKDTPRTQMKKEKNKKK